jgi:hypothetical protein
MSDSVGMSPPPYDYISSSLWIRPSDETNGKLTTCDATDRVFSHALSTVNKIQTGSEKPPAAIRLKLYGLYKQSMGTKLAPPRVFRQTITDPKYLEGNVEGIMPRPTGRDEAAQPAREKWSVTLSSYRTLTFEPLGLN